MSSHHIIPPPSSSGPGLSMLIDDCSEGSLAASHSTHQAIERESTKELRVQRVTIDILPSDALLEIFDHYLDQAREGDKIDLDAWHTLVQVCRKWRIIVLESPHRLNLQLLCTNRTPVRKMLGVWPAFPIVIRDRLQHYLNLDTDNIIAALGHRDRVCEISLGTSHRIFEEKLLPVMQEPFPALTRLVLDSKARGLGIMVVPDSFLGGTASSLRYLRLEGLMDFPELPKFLSSATGLVHLSLSGIPFSGEVVTSLSAMFKLQSLCLILPSSGHVDQPPPPTTRFLIPALSKLKFNGEVKYLEDLIARIEAPLIHTLDIASTFPPAFDTSQLRRLIGCAEQLTTLNRASIEFRFNMVVAFFRKTYIYDSVMPSLTLSTDFRDHDTQLQTLVEFCSSSLLPLSKVENLEITSRRQVGWGPSWEAGDSRWLEMLRPFPAVKNLLLSHDVVLSVVHTLINGNRERETEVLPAIQKLSLEGPLPSGPTQEAIELFVAGRRLSAHPKVPYCWVGVDTQDADD